ncbi:Platelet-activating factor acetylhydrolase [Verticillium dahliae VDG2]|nr:Platelet-activating factor acetylhydrolase [Verticillium dahliae VDG2]
MNCNACSTEDVLPNADKLRGRENWDEWAVRVGRILKRHSLFFVTRIREPHVNSMKGRSDRAMAIICQNCGPGVLAAQEGQCSNAWVMWRRLDFLYSPNHQGTTLNPRDFQARLLHDVHVFNAMFNRRFCQIYGSSCLDGRGSTSIPSAHLAYYDLVFYVYDGWVCRRKEREKEEPRVSLFAIQDELADYVSLMDFSMERWYGIMPPVDMMSGLEPNTRGKNSDFSPSENTQNRPHKCTICLKAFTRTDLLKRHAASHANTGSDQSATAPRLQGVDATPNRVTKACRACASNHLRCTETKPCSRCVEKGFDCQWSNLAEGLENGDSSDEGSDMDTNMQSEADVSSGVLAQDGQSTVESDCLGISMEATSSAPTGTSLYASQPVHHNGLLAHTSSGTFTPMRTSIQSQAQSPNPNFDVNLLFSDFPDLGLVSGSWTTPLPTTVPFDAAIELDDMDLQFLDTYNTTADQNEPASSTSNQIRAEAFRNFQWRFRPSVNDHAGAEEHNLSLPEAIDTTSPESRLSVNLRITCARLKSSIRDRILTLVIKSCRPGNLSKAVSSFPSVELLDTLVQYYLGSPMARTDSYIHTPTCDPNTKRPELVAAMAAAGAVLTLDPALVKLGYAIQESVRAALPEVWEKDNSLIRDLQLSQAFLISLELGMWSGYSRKAEISESFLQPLVTMLRRDNKLKKTRYLDLSLDPNLDDVSLEKAWHTWVDMEGFRRLAFRMMHHDAKSSMSLFPSPLISYAEVQLHLPSSPQLWMATTPQQWKQAVLAQGSPQKLTLFDVLDNPEATSAPDVAVDESLSREAFLSCVWGMAWEYIQMSSLQRAKPRRWNDFVTTTRRDELSKLLSHFQMSINLSAPTTANLELLIRLELALRLTRQLPPGTIRDFTAIMVYHASLTFWVYGLVADQQGPSRAQWTESPGDLAPPVVWLDELDGLLLQRFLQLGSGCPCIHGLSERGEVVGVPLSSPDQVMEIVSEVLRANFDRATRPLLVEKLVQLMAGLQRSSRGAEGGEM